MNDPHPSSSTFPLTYKACLLLFINFFLPFFTQASNDSLLQSVKVGYFMYNDNNTFNLQDTPYEERKRDDHGLTLSVGYQVEAAFNFFKKAVSSIRFSNHTSLYTRGLGTRTTLSEDDPNYADYEYLLDKHPDWAELYVNNQISYSKNVKELSFLNRYNHLTVGASMRYASIYSGKNQAMANTQRKFHAALKIRNYLHGPFTDSSIFKGRNIYYFSFAPVLQYNQTIIKRSKWQVTSRFRGRVWLNSRSDYQIPAFSPEINTNWKFSFGSEFTDVERKFNLDYGLHYEPNEIIQNFSDPGTNGSYFIALSVNFKSKKAKGNSHYLLYTLSPYSVYVPIGLEKDVTIDYIPRAGDLRIVEGFLNLSVSLMFNR